MYKNNSTIKMKLRTFLRVLVPFLKFVYLVSVDPFITCLKRLLVKKNRERDFVDDIVLVTGSAQGLGKAIAEKFAECGSTVILWDIDKTKLMETSTEMKSQGYEVFAYVVDCSKKDDVYRAAERVIDEVGNVSVIVNNAGIVKTKMIWELEDEQMLKAFLPWMMENNYGTIISISSICGFYGFPLASHYSASKAAVISICESLTAEFAMANKNGINVTCVMPGAVDTGLLRDCSLDTSTRELTQIGKMSPSYVAKKIFDAASNYRSTLVVPWFYGLLPFGKLFLPQKAMKLFFREANSMRLSGDVGRG